MTIRGIGQISGQRLRRRRTQRRSYAKGMSMVEATVSIVIVSVLLVAALSTLAASSRLSSQTRRHVKGQLFAQDLMAEILSCAYEEPDESALFGRETNEASDQRINYDDVDDYAGWSSSPLQSKTAEVLAGTDGWERTVSVDWVSQNDLTAVRSTETGIKSITVEVTFNGQHAATLTSIRSDNLPTPTNNTGNAPPVAVALASRQTGSAPLVVSFHGGMSTDPDVADLPNLKYEWDFGDGATASGISTSHFYIVKGTYEVTLEVSDGRGGFDVDIITINVTE
jgi:Tfp pilus assembly protein PilV